MKRIISIIAIFTLICVSICSCAPKDETPPKIKEGTFSFCVEYIYKGETYKYEDTILCNYVGLLTKKSGVKSPNTIRDWESTLQSSSESYNDVLVVKQYGVESIFTKGRTNTCSFVYLSFGRADYYMGENEYSDIDAPCFYYYESFKNSSGTQSGENTVLTEEQLEEYFGIKVVEFNFSSPIQNEYE